MVARSAPSPKAAHPNFVDSIRDSLSVMLTPKSGQHGPMSPLGPLFHTPKSSTTTAGRRVSTISTSSSDRSADATNRAGSILQQVVARSIGACTGEAASSVSDDVIDDVVRQRKSSSDFDTSSAFMQQHYSMEEDDNGQLKRLYSWGTNGTFGTIGTSTSDWTDTNDNGVPPQFDDDGNPIHPKIIEKTQASRGTRLSGRRKRLVKFEYPPISSLRQCPRTDPAEIPRLFFTEDELDQIEDDRESTYTADDVEVVAVASSLSDKDVPVSTSDTPSSAAATGPPPPSANAAESRPKFDKYVGTPARKSKKKQPTFNFDDVTGESIVPPSPHYAESPALSSRGRSSHREQTEGGTGVSAASPRKNRRRATPGPPKKRSSETSHPGTPSSVDPDSAAVAAVAAQAIAMASPRSHHSGTAGFDAHYETRPATPTTVKKERLIKSVQIYLRERSTGV